jgi:hypothetical protein
VCGYLSGQDYVMECAGGRVESRPVRRVCCSFLLRIFSISREFWNITILHFHICGRFVCLYYMYRL